MQFKMIFKQREKEETILLIVTSFNQINNFLSFFLEKKIIKKRKIYLIIFSDNIQDELIFNFKKYIEKYAIIEVIDMRRKSIKLKQKLFNSKIFNLFFYYYFVFKKIFKIKKSSITSYLITNSKIQFPTLFFMIFLSPLFIYLIEDGLGDYSSYENIRKKKTLSTYVFKFYLLLNKFKFRILQLAKSRNDYFGILNQFFLREEYYLNNRLLFKKFTENYLEKKILTKPKCILIGTRVLPHNFNIYKKLYIETLVEIKKRYSYNKEEILFFPHPRESLSNTEDLKKSLSNYSNIKSLSSSVVENYLSQDSLEIIIGTFSTALYYAKTIFNKNHVYYIHNFNNFNENKELNDHYASLFNSQDIKNFLSKN
jgi:hypothetical protein